MRKRGGVYSAGSASVPVRSERDCREQPSRRVLIGSFGTFVLVGLVSAIGPVIALPVISSIGGATAWSSVAVGTSVGGLSGIVVLWGWSIIGPVRAAAAANPQAVASLVWSSVASRGLLLAPLAPLAAVIAASLVASDRALAANTAVATLCAALSMNWYFIGRRQPRAALLCDGVPRLVLVVGSSIGMMLGCGLWLYPLCLTAGSILALGVSVRRICGSISPMVNEFRIGAVLNTYRVLAHGGIAQAASAVYINAPTVIVAVLAPEAVAVFAAAHRVYLLAIVALAPVNQVFVGWVLEPRRPTRQRMLVALWIQAAVGLASAIAFVALAPIVSRILFQWRIWVPSELWWIYGLAVLAVVLNRAVGMNVLIPCGRAQWISMAACTGAVAAIGFGFLTIPSGGAFAAAVSVLLAEVLVLIVELIGLRSAFRAGRRIELV